MAETTGKTKKRKVWIAGLLSFLVPGLGHLYCGRIVQAVVFVFIMILAQLIPLLWVHITQTITASLLITGGALPGVILLAAVIDAIRKAKRTGPDYRLKDYNRWYLYLLVFVVGQVGFGLTDRYTRVNFVENFRVPSSSNYPNIIPGEAVIANKVIDRHKNPKSFTESLR